MRATTDRLRLVPRPRASPDHGDAEARAAGERLRAEVRAASIVSGDIPGVGVGEEHDLGLALDDHALLAESPAAWRPDVIVERADGVDLRGTLVCAALGAEGRPVVEVRGVPVLLLGRGRLPPVGSRVLASGFLSVERRLWATAASDRRGVGRWTVARVRRQRLEDVTATGSTLRSVDLARLPPPDEVDVSDTYVLDLHRR